MRWLGYVQRDYPNVPARSYDGFNGRVSANYFPAGKTVLNLSVYRELGNADDTNATYSVNTGASLGAAWLATSKITLRANASIENRDYQGDPGGVIVGTTRKEDWLSGSLSVSYVPIRMAAVDFGWQAGSRDSNISVDDYSYHLFFASVRADF